MSQRRSLAAFGVVSLVVCVGAGVVVARDVDRAREVARTAPGLATVPLDGDLAAPGRIVFRHSGLDQANGLLASVATADPSGPRALSDVACDRVDAAAESLSCLRTHRGVLTTYSLDLLDAAGEPFRAEPLAGIPSRTRFSRDGSLVATTSFVSGHDYMSAGFSTATVVSRSDGSHSWGNLESFALVIDGERVRPVDRNLWGVTFVDDTFFYATVATGGRTWVVRGDLAERTLTSITENAECPSLSPDGTRLAFKVDVGTDGVKLWRLAVLDLASGERRMLSEETTGLDDQVEWLDDDTLLYALPREGTPGIQDVWAAPADGSDPRLLVEQASSPTVVPTAQG